MAPTTKKTATRKRASRKTTARSMPQTQADAAASKKKTSARRKSPAAQPVTTTDALDWSGSLDLTRAKELSEQLKGSLDTNDQVVITVHDVESVDVSNVQILLAGAHTASRDGKSLRLVDTDAALAELWQEVGFGTVYQRLVTDEAEVGA